MSAPRYIAGIAFAAATALTPKLLSDVEGTMYTPYLDVAGVLTVCEGVTGPSVVAGKTYSRAECDKLVVEHIQIAKRAVDAGVKVQIPDTMRASLYSFTYNVGNTAFLRSTMLKLINKGQLHQACNELFKWEVYTDPKTRKKVKSKGLHNRRVIEYGYCTKDLK